MKLSLGFAALALVLLLAVVWTMMRPVIDTVHPILVTDGYVRSTAQTGAAFMTIANQSGAGDRLIAARMDGVTRVELHTHIENADGVVMMRPIENGITIEAGSRAELARGGDHVMLMGLSGPLGPEDVTLTLVFEKSGEVLVVLPVKSDR